METYDIRNTLIPFSLLAISNQFKNLAPGETIEIIGSDDAIAADLRRILTGTAYEMTFAPQAAAHTGDPERPRLRLVKK